MVLEINEQTFEDEVTKADLPTVVDYWAPWCGPCQILGPMVEKLSEATKVVFGHGQAGMWNRDDKRQFHAIGPPAAPSRRW